MLDCSWLKASLPSTQSIQPVDFMIGHPSGPSHHLHFTLAALVASTDHLDLTSPDEIDVHYNNISFLLPLMKP